MKHRIVPIAIVLMELSAANAMAQGTDSTETKKAAETTKDQDKKAEKIEVTGSRIRRIDVETSAPVQVIDKKEIEQSGVVSLGDLFRKSATSSPTGNFAGSSGYVSAGAATVDLLGLGGSRTLVLLNGKRLPAIGGVDSVNIDNIPIGIVDKIEILSGGASAIYGADAVGGVVNIITRKDLTGTEISLFKTLTAHKGGDETEVTVAQGVAFGSNASAILSAGFRARSLIDKRERDLDYSRPERTNTLSRQPLGTWSYRPLIDDPAGLEIGDWTPSANCPTDKQVATVPDEPNNVYCTGKRKEAFIELMPQKRDWYAAATMNLALPSDWNLSGVLSYARSVNESNDGKYLPYAIDPISGDPIILSRTKALELGVIPDSEVGDFFQVYMPVAEFPDRTYINTFNTLTAAAYLDGNVGEWKASAGLAFAASDTLREGKKIFNSETLAGLFVNPDDPDWGADPVYIPLDPNRDQSLFASAFENFESKLKNQSTSVDVFFSKDLFEMPAGNFALGVGGSFAAESFKLNPDQKDTQFNYANEPLYTGTFADRGDGSRSISSVYTEFVAPVQKGINVEGAFRFDHYSDFDNTANFGLGVKASIFPFLGVRARAASSFTAPSLSSLHQVGGGGYLYAKDEKWCQREIDENRICDLADPYRQIYVDQPGNPDLKPEVGLNYIAGVILDPLPGLSLVSDYYMVNLKKTFNTDQLQEIVDAWYTANPNSTVGGKIKENPVETDADGIISKVGLPIRNLGRFEVRAVDSKLAYSVTLGGLRYGLDSQYFRMLSYKIQEVQDKPIREQKGFTGVPEWRWNNRFTLDMGKMDVALSARTIGRQTTDPDTATEDDMHSKVAVYTEYDLSYSAELPWNGSVQVGVNDMFDTIGGVVNGNAIGSEDIATDSLYSYVGRSFFVRVTQRL